MAPWRDPEERDLSGEIGDEIRFYLEMRAREFEDGGMEPDEAWRAAVRAFGDPDQIRRQVVREERMKRWRSLVVETFGSVLQDLRIAARSFRREPVFLVVAITTLALGIGASTGIFSLANQALLAGPGVSEPDEVVAVYTTSRRGAPRSSNSYPDFLDYRDRTEALQDLAATALTSAALGSETEGARLVTVQTVTGNYFDLLGLTPAVGRLLTPDDDGFGGGTPVAVLSHALWRTHFGAAPDVTGATIRLSGRAYEVVGVAPVGFDGLRIDVQPQLWIPMQTRPYLTGGGEDHEGRFEVRGNRWIDLLVGRLAAGASVESARAELFAVSDQLRTENPGARGPRHVTVDPLDGHILPNGSEADFRTFVLLLGGTVGLALLLCCANLANLLLARGATRRRDVSVRLAIGAGRPRIVRQLVTESALLAAIGGASGLLVAAGLLRVFGAFELPGGVPIASLGVTLDAGALGLAVLVTLATVLLFGVVPAVEAGRTELSGALRSGRGQKEGRGTTNARMVLVSAQVALSLVLLVGSGLFMRTLREGLATDLGFRPDGVAAMRYNLDLAGYGPEDAWSFVRTLEERLEGGSGIASVTTATRVPLQNGGAMGFFFAVDGYEAAPDEELRVDLVYTTPGYAETLGLPIVDGRDFTDADADGAEPVAIVSRAMAERYWPGGRAVGGLVSARGTELRVVGVFENATWNGLADEVTNYMFMPMAQSPSVATRYMTIACRSASPEATLTAMRSVLSGMDRDVTVVYSDTMEDMVSAVLMPQRMGAVLLTGFGVLALVLSIVGIAGVVAYVVSRRRREIAVRVALGATGDSILRRLMTTMSLPVLAGLVTGLLAARGLTGAVERLLFRVSPTDPVTYAVISVGVVVVSLCATVIPARRAARVDPAEVLGTE